MSSTVSLRAAVYLRVSTASQTEHVDPRWPPVAADAHRGIAGAQRAITSTSRSTPLTTLNSLS
jgi:hypothetical protein